MGRVNGGVRNLVSLEVHAFLDKSPNRQSTIRSRQSNSPAGHKTVAGQGVFISRVNRKALLHLNERFDVFLFAAIVSASKDDVL